MTDRRADHASFKIERTYGAAPDRIFAAWAEPAAKRHWFAEGDGFTEVAHALDFRVGGTETCSGREPKGRMFANESVYHDIVDNERIIFSYRMAIDGAPISVSLATVTFAPRDGGTRLIFTEQSVFLEGGDGPDMRQGGWTWLLDRLGQALSAEAKHA